jgi:hypothetical protein
MHSCIAHAIEFSRSAEASLGIPLSGLSMTHRIRVSSADKSQEALPISILASFGQMNAMPSLRVLFFVKSLGLSITAQGLNERSAYVRDPGKAWLAAGHEPFFPTGAAAWVRLANSAETAKALGSLWCTPARPSTNLLGRGAGMMIEAWL